MSDSLEIIHKSNKLAGTFTRSIDDAKKKNFEFTIIINIQMLYTIFTQMQFINLEVINKIV